MNVWTSGISIAALLISLGVDGQETSSPASQKPPKTVTAQSYPPEQVLEGGPLFAAQCGFCHGRDAGGGESGPDLTRSALVAGDVRGDKIGPVVRNGRVDRGMPALNIADRDLAAVVAFIHDQKTRAESQAGGRRTVDVADLQTGDAESGKRYFNGAGGCSNCHSPSGDLAGIGKRLEGLALLRRMLYPDAGSGARGGESQAAAVPERLQPRVTVTPRSGQKITGKLVHRDEFTIALRDASGWYRSWPANEVTFSIDNPIDAHVEQLARYSDDDMHDVLAYLQTLR